MRWMCTMLKKRWRSSNLSPKACRVLVTDCARSDRWCLLCQVVKWNNVLGSMTVFLSLPWRKAIGLFWTITCLFPTIEKSAFCVLVSFRVAKWPFHFVVIWNVNSFKPKFWVKTHIVINSFPFCIVFNDRTGRNRQHSKYWDHT